MAIGHFSGQATTFGAIAPGVCFAAAPRDKTQIGLKIRDRRGCKVILLNDDYTPRAETKATEGTEAGRAQGYPLQFMTDPEE